MADNGDLAYPQKCRDGGMADAGDLKSLTGTLKNDDGIEGNEAGTHFRI